MPNELTIPAVPPSVGVTDPPQAGKTPAPVAAAPTPAQPFANPSLRLDPSLGLVVIEFRNDAGAVTRSIPSQRQIDAYRLHEEAVPRAGVPPVEEG
jgi:hypothetical protein